MTASRLHLVRHGEVQNPGGVVYGRLPGFPLTARGHRMADAAAQHIVASGRAVSRVLSSPLERALQSAEPAARRLGLGIEPRDRLIEAASRLEGDAYSMSLQILTRPAAWRFLVNPFRPSWGEPFVEVTARMVAELHDAWATTDGGDVVLVSHQLPIWMAHRAAVGRAPFHDPRRRRCALSSITSFELVDGAPIEIGYEEPARPLLSAATDVGAV